MESIRLGTVLLEPSLPIFVAEERNFFSKNKLDVVVKYYDVGLNAAKGVVNGEVDLSTPVAEYVLVGRVFEKKNLKAVANIDKVDYAFVVGRKDRGIQTISDLKGKRIGVVRGTILDFQLGRFLDLHGLSIRDVELVHGTLGHSAEAIARGDIDAVMSIPPFIGTVQARLGDNAVLWPAQNSQPFHSLVLGQGDWIKQNPKAVKRFLKAMSLAEEYIAQHPEQAKVILKRKLNFTDDEVNRVWSQNQFALSLDQSLISAMEDEARWMIKNDLTTEKLVPDFLNYLHLDGLKAVKPEAVNIIR